MDRQPKICKNLRGLWAALLEGVYLSDRMQRHVQQCPRCQRRLTGLGRLRLALDAIKSRPHGNTLLGQANSSALRMLNRSVREVPQARRLEQARPALGPMRYISRYTYALANAAACLMALALLRTGIFESMDSTQQQGRNALHGYYSQYLGEDETDDLMA